MSHQQVWICDRCSTGLFQGSEGYGISVTFNFHHPKKLDFCPKCNKELEEWLGYHPLFGEPPRPNLKIEALKVPDSPVHELTTEPPFGGGHEVGYCTCGWNCEANAIHTCEEQFERHYQKKTYSPSNPEYCPVCNGHLESVYGKLICDTCSWESQDL